MKKPNYIYQDQNGEYFKSVEKDGGLVLSNPSYPFVFKWEVLEPIKEIGEAEKFGHLVEKIDSQFYEGDSLTVEVKDGNLAVVDTIQEEK